MSGSAIIRSSTGTQTALVPSGSHPVSRVSSRSTRVDQVFAMGTLSSTAAISGHRTGSSRLTSSRSSRSGWARAQPALPIAGIPAMRGHLAPVRRSEPVLPMPSADNVAPAPPKTPASAETAAPIEPGRKKTSATSKVDLIIDSLQSYELTKPIPVVVESLGERHHVAEVPELGISISGSSLSDTLIVLKEHVTKTYDGLRIKKHLGQNLDKERARQLKMFESYIGKPRRTWF